ncbi:flagellin [Kerstersia gyiorum]|uniref:Flagellin n=1 Tax=Kerstersia gyiorum TaxID=206506 RepID=A0A4Q7MMR6_9BURK|nr:FliC/FljB family flagellin [Kerstersia gyiorum]KAB0544498.1 FliC/FljB family flagellin [Kerstersia gyiorum]RZS69636.1 flagellin [Kerstersia gyiorum]
MSVINTNYLALVSQNNLSKSQNALGTAIERLSSGLRINSAKDDAAGQAIANRFTANIKGLTQASRNANDGISIAQTTEGALNEINNNLQRVRELTVQAATGSNSKTDLDTIQAEITQRLGEINRVSEQTQFNGVKVLASNQTLSIQVGSHDSETISVNLQKINRNSLNLSNLDATKIAQTINEGDAVSVTTAPVTETKLSLDTTGITGQSIESGIFTDGTNYYVKDSGASETYYQIDLDNANPDTGAVTQDISGATAVTTGTFTPVTSGNEPTVRTASAGEPDDGKAKIDLSANTAIANNQNNLIKLENSFYIRSTDASGNTSYYDATPGAKDAAGNITFTVATTATTDAIAPEQGSPLAALDQALQQVDSLRSDLGAIQNRFQSTIANLNNTVNNLSAARSRIEDADYAVEVSNMTRAQILQQAGTSVLAQANQVPQTVLSLLR